MNTQKIPQPKKRFFTRLGIPLAIILITACILVYASWASIRSTIMVEAVTVVMRNVETNNPKSTAAEQGSIVQAPGWVEAEPYSIYAGALTPGIIESILVLEGDVVEKGQPIATLISDDNKLAFKATEATESLWLGKLKAANANMQETCR